MRLRALLLLSEVLEYGRSQSGKEPAFVKLPYILKSSLKSTCILSYRVISTGKWESKQDAGCSV